MKSIRLFKLFLVVVLLLGAFGYRAFAASVPDAPVLKSADSKSYNSVKITWEEVSNAEGYYVYRKVSGGSWERIADVSSGSTVTYTDTGLTCGTEYIYTVRAYCVENNDRILGSYSKTGITCTPVPGTPSLKSAESVSYNSVNLTWGKVSGADGYYVYRKVPGGSWKRVKTVSSGATVTYTDTELTCGAEYIYTVKAYCSVDDARVPGGYSKAGISGKPVPGTPSLESAESVSYTSIKLTWGKVSGASGYYVYRKLSGGSWERIKNITSGSTVTYKNTGLTCGTSYIYTVKAYCEVGSTKVFGGYLKTGITGKPVPSTPTLKSAQSISYSSIKLTWSKVAEADGYYVYRKLSEGSWKRIATVTSGSTVSYKDTGLTCGSEYIYSVRAYCEVGGAKVYGSYSKTGISCKPVPAAPVLKSAESESYDSISLTWSKVSGASGYYVYRKLGDAWERIKTLTSGSTATYIDTGLESGTTYFYTVRAYRTVDGVRVSGSYDKDGISTETMTLEQVSMAAAAYSDTRIQVEWEYCEDADGYQVWRSIIADSGYTLVGSTEKLEYLDTSLVKGMTYYYKVRSYKALNGNTVYGEWSDIQKVSLPAMYDSGKLIMPLENGINIYIAGDSTTRNYAENGINQNGVVTSHGSWGEYLQNFFDSEEVQVNDYGISKLSARSFMNQGWLEKISSTIQSGDYLFIQFGHNDREVDSTEHYTMLGEPDEDGIYPVIAGEKTETPSDLKDSCGDLWYAQDSGTYKWYLYQYVDTALNAGATPVLVTPVSRLLYDSNGTIRCHHDPSDADVSERKDAYVTAMKQVYDEYQAKGKKIYLIDMYSITKKMYEEAYQADSDASGTTSPLAMELFDTNDSTHNSKLGGFILAVQMAREIHNSDFRLADKVKQPKNVTSVAADNQTPAVIVDHLSQFTGYALTLSGNAYTAKKSSYWIAIGKGLISGLE